MKLYVDELPKSCSACPHCYHEYNNLYCCVIRNKFMEFFNDDYLKREKECPLQSLANYTKQVRKELCEDIRNFIHSGEYDNFGIEYLRTGLAVLEKLDEVQSKDS